MSNNRYSILLIDDHPIVTSALGKLIHAHEEVSCTSANTLDELNQILSTTTFDLCITDLEFPGISAFDLIRTIHKSLPQCRILIYTMHEEPWIALKLCDKNIHPFISGALSKHAETDEIYSAIDTIRSGKAYFSSPFSIVAKKRHEESIKYAYELSKSEEKILALLTNGLNTRQIAEHLHVTQNTVQTHRKKILEKMDAKNVAELVYKCKGLFNEGCQPDIKKPKAEI